MGGWDRGMEGRDRFVGEGGVGGCISDCGRSSGGR